MAEEEAVVGRVEAGTLAGAHAGVAATGGRTAALGAGSCAPLGTLLPRGGGRAVRSRGVRGVGL
jgi:hypothetical protein